MKDSFWKICRDEQFLEKKPRLLVILRKKYLVTVSALILLLPEILPTRTKRKREEEGRGAKVKFNAAECEFMNKFCVIN